MPLKLPNGKVRRPAFISIGTRFVLLGALITSIALGSLVILNWQHKSGLAKLVASETAERKQTLREVHEHLERDLALFTRTWAQRTETAHFLAQPQYPWNQSGLLPALAVRNFSRAWIVGSDGETVFDSLAPEGRPVGPAPTTLAEVMRLHPTKDRGAFAFRLPEGTTEIGYALIQSDPGAQPLGLLLVGRTFDPTRLQELGTLVRGTVTLGSEAQGTPHGPGAISAALPLRGLDGVAFDSLNLSTTAPEFNLLVRQKSDLRVLVLITYLFAGIVAFAMTYSFIIRPIDQITASLASQSTAPLRTLVARRDEIGALATLVVDSFERKHELEQLLHQRAQLGRELHDSVIQTVYAAGLNISGAASLCRADPERAAALLESTRRDLNTTIRELRSFIAELEPEDGEERTLGDAARSIVGLMTAPHAIDVTLKIDAEAAAALDRNQRLHVLRVIRESVSNVVRHARAKLITVEFQRRGEEGVLVVSDNGVGFAPAAVAGGRGLMNLKGRAADLGGRCEITSSVGHGTRLTVSFPVRSFAPRGGN